jgi:DNA invertase Pin-like site-specific DNA recombinase
LRGIDDGIVNNPNHALHGIPIVKTYQVTHQSHRGLAGRGTQYDDMIRDAKDGVFGYLLVDKIDRLGRNLIESVAMGETMSEAGVQIVSAKEPFDPKQPAGWYMIMTMRLMADFYSRNLAVEVRKGLREKLERGEWPSRPPYGYRFRDDQPTITPGRRERHVNVLIKQEPFASHVSTAFTEFATGNYTLDEWEAAAFARGMRTVTGKRITDGMWSRYLHDTIYIHWTHALLHGSREGLCRSSRHTAPHYASDVP